MALAHMLPQLNMSTAHTWPPLWRRRTCWLNWVAQLAARYVTRSLACTPRRRIGPKANTKRARKRIYFRLQVSRHVTDEW